MPRIVPSQIVDLIDKIFPWAVNQGEMSHSLSRNECYSVAALVDLVEEIPQELLFMPNQSYAAFISALAALKIALQTWPHKDLELEKIHGFGNINPVTIIRNALVECPDEFPSTGTLELTFIQDHEFRRNLEIDISAANLALSNGQWKASTVLSASVVEVLLMWKLIQFPISDVDDIVKVLVVEKVFKNKPDCNLSLWNLHHFIEVVSKSGIISSETKKTAELAKDFRNLIHPGREFRLKQKCDRGTAFLCMAAVEFVVRDLKNK